MSIASYNDLKIAVANWLNDSNLNSYIGDFITLAEARIYREIRVEAMKTALSATMASGVISVPADFLEFENVYIDGSPIQPLEVVTSQFILSKFNTRSADTKPRYIARNGDQFIFGPYPDSDYDVKGTYYKKLTALSSASTNWFTDNAPDILLYATLLEAEPFIMNDERVLLWEHKYQNAKTNIQQQDDKSRLKGSPKRSVPS